MAMNRRKKSPYQSVWGKRNNGLPFRTLVTVVVALNLARRAGGVYVEDGMKRLAHLGAGPESGGSWWFPIRFSMPKPMVLVVPQYMELS